MTAILKYPHTIYRFNTDRFWHLFYHHARIGLALSYIWDRSNWAIYLSVKTRGRSIVSLAI